MQIPSPTPVEEVPSHPTNTVCLSDVSQPSDDEEDSIEAYMARLLKRVRGESEPAPLPPANPEPAEMPPAPPEMAAIPEVEQKTMDAPVAAAPVEFQPRHRATEKWADNMEAMRELANQSARTAIKTSDQRRNSSEARDKFLVAGVAAVIGTMLLCLSQSLFSITVLGALCTFGVGGYWIYQAYTIRKEVASAGEGEPQQTTQGTQDAAVAQQSARRPQ